ncbi:nucleoside-diphosphate sugar epimerase/dehydratase [Rhabdochromatium marinum]|uniref:polysaccharide biosynthesis protein n=1 Tax=Rhabdochromatium marinum TaxID=48729 RepID=UPI001907A2E6|nr:nucleoside-diphosphate sugar epimerase/dehydratase [Rhabdochromatium marinum]MBK1647496.1 polysaccharide biosynthesis protein [Rhabdochromatium marinum]
MVPAAWLLAFWTRFNFESIPPPFLNSAWRALLLVLPLCVVVYWLFGLYRGVWRFASLPDLTRILKAALTATAATLAILFAFNRMAEIPRSVPVLFLLFQLVLLAGPRLLYRWAKDRRISFEDGQRVLIVGAGRAGEMLVRDMLRDPAHSYQPIAFVDDRPRHHGGSIHGVPIKGVLGDVPALVERLGIDLILLAVPSASATQMQQLVTCCEQTGKPFRTVPQLQHLMAGEVSINQLREVCIEDLLGRHPVRLDWDGIGAGLAGRCILVTGAGGSIGSELCRQLMAAGARRLILVDACELNLYRIELELLESHPPAVLARYLLDVTDAEALETLFRLESPQIVFHAAAYKHVPLLENQVRAAVRNNVLGTRVVANAAAQAGCERFVLISTDKAVNPANVMGATKRVAEQLCLELASRSATRFMLVRFGNVLGSAGSVVPLFKRQIARGGPVTVTDPDIERFFMTIPEACQLIMQAAVIGQGGEVFVLDMGEPVKIRFLAEQMIRLSGREPGTEIPIRYIGLRPGEKRFEELFYTNEDTLPTAHPKIRAARRTADARVPHNLAAAVDELIAAAGDEPRQRQALSALVPGWSAVAEQCSDQ